MAFLGREGEHSNAPRPDLNLLDLNLPKKDGLEVLAELKESPALKSMLMIILMTSPFETDIEGSYQHPCELLHHQARGPRGVPETGEQHR